MKDDKAWETSTWEGNRRLMLRRALRLTVRQRLQCLESLAETNRRFQEMPRRNTAPSRNEEM